MKGIGGLKNGMDDEEKEGGREGIKIKIYRKEIESRYANRSAPLSISIITPFNWNKYIVSKK